MSTRYLQGYFEQLVSWGYNDLVYHDELGGGCQAVSATTPLGDYIIVINESYASAYRTDPACEDFGHEVQVKEQAYVEDFADLLDKYERIEAEDHAAS